MDIPGRPLQRFPLIPEAEISGAATVRRRSVCSLQIGRREKAENVEPVSWNHQDTFTVGLPEEEGRDVAVGVAPL